MKKILPFLFLLIATCSFGQFLETGLVWNYTYEPFLPPPLDTTRITSVSIIGDTIIDNKKVYILEGECACGFRPRYLYQEEQQMFYFYEGQFHLLYDFSLVAGDTLKIVSVFSAQWIDQGVDTLMFTIDSVTHSPHIGADTLNIQHITALPGYNNLGEVVDFPQWGNRIIQHVGSDYCLFPMVGFCENGSTLRCLQLSIGETINFTAGEGCLLNSIYSPQDLDLSIYPNPFQDFFQIKNPLGDQYLLRIYNTQGQLVLESPQEQSINKTVQTSNWPGGIYILEMKKEGLRAYQKMMKF